MPNFFSIKEPRIHSISALAKFIRWCTHPSPNSSQNKKSDLIYWSQSPTCTHYYNFSHKGHHRRREREGGGGGEKERSSPCDKCPSATSWSAVWCCCRGSPWPWDADRRADRPRWACPYTRPRSSRTPAPSRSSRSSSSTRPSATWRNSSRSRHAPGPAGPYCRRASSRPRCAWSCACSCPAPRTSLTSLSACCRRCGGTWWYDGVLRRGLKLGNVAGVHRLQL